eukprot:5192565-Amphidinium_carterae.1
MSLAGADQLGVQTTQRSRSLARLSPQSCHREGLMCIRWPESKLQPAGCEVQSYLENLGADRPCCEGWSNPKVEGDYYV